MRVYISGKIGEEVISEATRQKFARAEAMLKEKGYDVFNPCDERWQQALKRAYEIDRCVQSPLLSGKFPDFYAYVLLRDQMTLSTMEAIYMLDDWEESNGARSEYAFAMATGKQIIFARREHAVLRLEEDWKEANKAMKMKTPRYKFVDLHLHKLWLPLEGSDHE